MLSTRVDAFDVDGKHGALACEKELRITCDWGLSDRFSLLVTLAVLVLFKASDSSALSSSSFASAVCFLLLVLLARLRQLYSLWTERLDLFLAHYAVIQSKHLLK